MGLTTEHVEAVRPSWVKMTLPEQLANIGSEVSRVIKGRSNHARYWGAITRALDLFYLTIEDPRWQGRRKEILRTQELFCAAALGSDEFKTTLEDLDKYFLYYALLAYSEKK